LPAPAGQLVLPDRTGKTCYALGPALVTGTDVSADSVIDDSTQSTWVVSLHFADTRFLTRIAKPLSNHEIAIVLNGVVETALIVNPGIKGHDVVINAGFNREQAVSVAASIMGVPLSKVRVGS
jgi:preprotein translocase subunit SecD